MPLKKALRAAGFINETDIILTGIIISILFIIYLSLEKENSHFIIYCDFD